MGCSKQASIRSERAWKGRALQMTTSIERHHMMLLGYDDDSYGAGAMEGILCRACMRFRSVGSMSDIR